MVGTQIKGRAPRQTYRCPVCPTVELRSWAACERHRDELGHGRFDVLNVALS